MKAKNNSRILLASGLIIVIGITTAYAFGGRSMGHGGHWMARADVNGDGAITIEEVEAMRAKRFAKFDLNSDGVVDKAEIEARIRKRIERMATRLTRRFDKNRDGRITKEEFNARAVERFSWNDLNDDGKLSGDELPRKMHRRSHHNR